MPTNSPPPDTPHDMPPNLELNTHATVSALRISPLMLQLSALASQGSQDAAHAIRVLTFAMNSLIKEPGRWPHFSRIQPLEQPPPAPGAIQVFPDPPTGRCRHYCARHIPVRPYEQNTYTLVVRHFVCPDCANSLLLVDGPSQDKDPP